MVIRLYLSISFRKFTIFVPEIQLQFEQELDSPASETYTGKLFTFSISTVKKTTGKWFLFTKQGCGSPLTPPPSISWKAHAIFQQSKIQKGVTCVKQSFSDLFFMVSHMKNTINKVLMINNIILLGNVMYEGIV